MNRFLIPQQVAARITSVTALKHTVSEDYCKSWGQKLNVHRLDVP